MTASAVVAVGFMEDEGVRSRKGRDSLPIHAWKRGNAASQQGTGKLTTHRRASQAIMPLRLRVPQVRTEYDPNEGAEEIPAIYDDPTREQFAAMSEFELAERNLTPTDRDELVRTGEAIIEGYFHCNKCREFFQAKDSDDAPDA